MSEKLSIIDFLFQTGMIENDTFKRLQVESNTEKYLLDNGVISETALNAVKKNYENLNKIEINNISIEYDIVKKLSERLARKTCAVVFSTENGLLHVAMKNPLNMDHVAELTDFLQVPIKSYLANYKNLDRIINLTYRSDKKISKLSKIATHNFESNKINKSSNTSGLDITRSPAFELLHTLFQDAKRVDCSDIHIEYDNELLRIRLRIDGIMEEQILEGARDLGPPLIRIIKLNSGMDISITSFPQDGRIDMQLDSGDVISGRVSTIPNLGGGSCVIRLFQDSDKIPEISKVIPDEELKKELDSFLIKIQGMMLITGPTGSGKTTTLYSILNSINSFEKKIITIEDPVELRLPRINQVEISASSSFDFADALKSCLRQDPDIVLVGEIRDENTANIALRAAITGHLVLSTLHTNSTQATITRLLNLNIAPTLLADGINMVLSQRLMRRICNSCKELVDINDVNIMHNVQKLIPNLQDYNLYKGMGCNLCNNTGYRGRIPIIEYLTINQQLSDFLEKSDTSSFKECSDEILKGRLLIDLAKEQLLKGATTLEEFYRFLI